MIRAQILQPTPGNLMLAAEALLGGSPVAMPTETVYGLAASALDPLALARIFETKDRPILDPLIIHIGHIGHVGLPQKRVEDLERLGLVDAGRLSPAARELAARLMDKFWPGPLTLVLPKHENVPDLATSGLDSVGLRMSRHPVAQALIAACGIPLAAPSANRFGRISPTTASHVAEELGERIDLIVDGGPCEVGIESTILSIGESGELTLLRPGGLPLEDIEKALEGTGARFLRAQPPSAGNAGRPAPGMLESHYAPRKPLLLLPSALEDLGEIPREWKLSGKAGLLVIRGEEAQASDRFRALTGIWPLCRVLSPSGNLAEAARKLFSSLRELDQSDVPVIVSEPCAIQAGLGYAIGDRLRRASVPRKPEPS